MGMGYRWFIRPLLKLQDSEKAHLRSLHILRRMSHFRAGKWLLNLMFAPRYSLPVELFGTQYKHPFGLAAGMDKNGVALQGWPAIGLAFAEIGGVTMLAQEGNPRPRMFRSDVSQALVNRMGFNNLGSEKIRTILLHHQKRFGKSPIPLWANLGKSKLTPIEDAHHDYATSLARLWECVDVFVINVSSPNTPQLRELQNDDHLARILQACQEANLTMSDTHQAPQKPILVKIAPDITSEQLKSIILTSQNAKASGIVVCNTTVSRPQSTQLKDIRIFEQTGGLSGKPLKERSTELIRTVRNLVGPDWPIIGVGGISSADDAYEKILAGATLVQAYSGFVFEGPALCKQIVHGLQHRLQKDGFRTVAEAIGSSHSSG